MDYKKKYEDALERAKKYKLKEDLIITQDIFPELKESEDERIRKSIIAILKNYVDDSNTFKPKMIAWLEKQGDSPIKWNKNTKDNKPQKNHSILMQTTHGIAEGEWQGEHWHQYRWASLVRDSDVLFWIELSELEKQGEQKPNPCDECINVKGCINCENGELRETEQKPVQEIEPTPIFRIGDTLKRKGRDYTFRVDRIQGGYYHCDRNHGAFFPIEEQGNWELVEQKPAWSEEDEMNLEDSMRAIKCSNYFDFESAKENVLNWLDSLKNRYTWKPSDEQLNNILDVFLFDNCTPNRIELLESLYADLKKLKGE